MYFIFIIIVVVVVAGIIICLAGYDETEDYIGKKKAWLHEKKKPIGL